MTKPATTAPSRSVVLRDTEVRALLANGTVQVRRPVKSQPHECPNGDLIYRNRLIGSAIPERSWTAHGPYEEAYEVCPFDAPGTALAVREHFRYVDFEFLGGDQWNAAVEYRDGSRGPRSSLVNENTRFAWRSPATMPRWASRLNVQTTAVSVEHIDGVWTWVGTFRRVEATP